MGRTLQKITVTGADDQVSVEALWALQQVYPKLEFGLLITQNYREVRPRYPSRSWLQRLVEEPLNLSVHLCGQVVRELIDYKSGEPPLIQELKWLWPKVQRIQWNVGDFDTNFLGIRITDFIERPEIRGKELIVQVTPTKQYRRELAVKAVNMQDSRPEVGLLYDASGGRGLRPDVWPKPDLKIKHIGFAGGLNPENLAENLGMIQLQCRDHAFNIDVESGIRDESDKWDFGKVHDFVQVAQGWAGVG